MQTIVGRAIKPSDVVASGRYTEPATFGVYQLPYEATSPMRFHGGNHPIRMRELERDFGACTLTFLFLSKEDAEMMAAALNGRT